MRDRQEILDCINMYGRGLDRLDPDLIAAAFHNDAIDNHGPFVGTLQEFVPWAIEVESELLWTHHGITSHNCEINGDEAHAESYVYWVSKMREDGKLVALGGGRYIDRLERRNNQWKISLRRLLMDYVFVVPTNDYMGEEWTAKIGTRDRDDPSYMRPLKLPPDLEKVLEGKLKSG